MSHSKVNTAYACASCSGSKRRCPPRTSSGSRCIECEKHLKKGENDSPEVIGLAHPFPSQRVEDSLLVGKPSPKPFESSVDNENITLHVDICGDSGRKLEIALDVSQWYGMSPPEGDRGVCTLLASIHRVFSPEVKFKGRGPDTGLISDAVLAGGILYVLCSTIVIAEQVRTYIGGAVAQNDHEGCRLDFLFRRLLVSKLMNLVKTITDAIRTQGGTKERHVQAYAAATILNYEAEYFIKRYSPDNHIVAGLEGPFVDWLTSVNRELHERIREGCGRVPLWRSSINESIRKFHQRHRQFEKIQVILHLQRHQPESNLPQMTNWSTPPPEPSYPPDMSDLSPLAQPYYMGISSLYLDPLRSPYAAYPSPTESLPLPEASEPYDMDYSFVTCNNAGEASYNPPAQRYYDPVAQSSGTASNLDPPVLDNPYPYYYY